MIQRRDQTRSSNPWIPALFRGIDAARRVLLPLAPLVERMPGPAPIGTSKKEGETCVGCKD